MSDNPLISWFVDTAKQSVKDAAHDGALTIVKFIQEMVSGAYGKVLSSVNSLWINSSFPIFHDPTGKTVTGYEYLLGLVNNITPFIAAMAFMVGGIYIVLTKRLEPFGEMLMGLARLAFATLAAITIIPTFGSFADAFTNFIMNNAPQNSNTQLFGEGNGGSIADMYMNINIDFIGIIVSIVLLLIMIVRQGVVILIAAFFPWSAALSISGYKELFNKQLCWLISWVMFKPIAAMIFTFSFFNFNANDSIITALSGLSTLCLAVILLPIMLNNIVPAKFSGGWLGENLGEKVGNIGRAGRDGVNTVSNKLSGGNGWSVNSSNNTVSKK